MTVKMNHQGVSFMRDGEWWRRYNPNCRSGCPTQNHRSYADCCQGLSINSGAVYSKDRAWNKELDAYDNAVAAGMQPAGTSMAKVDEAVRISDATGVPYRAA